MNQVSHEAASHYILHTLYNVLYSCGAYLACATDYQSRGGHHMGFAVTLQASYHCMHVACHCARDVAVASCALISQGHMQPEN